MSYTPQFLVIFGSLIGSFLHQYIRQALLFLESTLLSSYAFSGSNNEALTYACLDHIAANLLFWHSDRFKLKYDNLRVHGKFSNQTRILSDGIYFFWFKNCFMWAIINDTYSAPTFTGKFSTIPKLSIITFRFNTWGLDTFIDMMTSSPPVETYLYDSKSTSFTIGGEPTWQRCRPLQYRPMSSVFLPNKIRDTITEDIATFLESKEQYSKRFIPHKRGILLYGPPGTGKTSLINAIATEFNMSIYLGDARDTGRLPGYLRAVAPRSIVLFEDIDTVFGKREEIPSGVLASEDIQTVKAAAIKSFQNSTAKESMSEFFNCIDGFQANSNGIIYIFTTNHIQKLDDALIRPGRMDLHLEIDNLRAEEAKDMICHFREDIVVNNALLECITNITDKGQTSPASLSEFLIRYMNKSDKELLKGLQTNGENLTVI